ncbi:MAG: tetratricopeptide repeat protein [Planctomycetota bacterium]
MSEPRSIPLKVLPEPRPSRAPTSRIGRWRAGVLIAVHVLIVAHVVQWLVMGKTISPVEPSESMQTLEQGLVNAGAIMFALAILSTLVFGRFFCGWLCHVVALQDLCGWMLKKVGIRPKPFRSRLLVLVPTILALYMFVWPTFKRFVLAPVLERVAPGIATWFTVPPFPDAGFTNHLITEDFWATFPPWFIAVPFLFVCGFVCVYVLGAKGFCTYGCPYGGFFAPVDTVSVGRIVVDDDLCERCGYCTANCTSNVRVHEEIHDHGMVVDPGCMKCMDCVSVCPNDALSFSFRTPAAIKGKPEREPTPKRFDTSIAEDLLLLVVFLFWVMAMRSLYGLIPLLMAVGIAACMTFFTWKALRVLRDANVRALRIQIKKRGRLTGAGAVASIAFVLATLFGAHSWTVNMSKWVGHALTDRIDVSADEALTPFEPGETPESRYGRETVDRAERALAHLNRSRTIDAGGIGFLGANPTDTRIAKAALTLGNPEQAETALRRVIERSGPGDEIVVDLAGVLLLQSRGAEALRLLASTLEAHPDFWRVRERQMLVSTALGPDAIAPQLQDAREALQRLPNPDNAKRTAERERRQEAIARTHLVLARLLEGTPARTPEELDAQRAQVMRAYLAATEVDPDNAYAWESLASGYVRLRGNFEAALKALGRSLELNPANTQGWFFKAQFAYELGNNELGDESLERAFESTDTPETKRRIATDATNMMRMLGRPDEEAKWDARVN